MEIERSKQITREINMIPLINLVFLLLIFFLVAGTIEKFDVINVDIPIADSGKVLDEGHIVIVLGYYDEVLLNDELISLDEMQQTVKALLVENPQKIISLKADAKLDANRMVEVLELIRSAGGENLSIITQSVKG